MKRVYLACLAACVLLYCGRAPGGEPAGGGLPDADAGNWNSFACINRAVPAATDRDAGYRIAASAQTLAEIKDSDYGPEWNYSLTVEAEISSNGAVSFSGDYSFTRKRLIGFDATYAGPVALGVGNVSVDDDGQVAFTPPLMLLPSGADAGVYLIHATCVQHNMPEPVPDESFHIATLYLGYLYFARAGSGKASWLKFPGVFFPSGVSWHGKWDQIAVNGVWNVPVYIIKR